MTAPMTGRRMLAAVAAGDCVIALGRAMRGVPLADQVRRQLVDLGTALDREACRIAAGRPVSHGISSASDQIAHELASAAVADSPVLTRAHIVARLQLTSAALKRVGNAQTAELSAEANAQDVLRACADHICHAAALGGGEWR